ncbi:uncharacterized protein [Linepithema humile]|uniref:uncharacterized protein isoform X2 n=1 Tax=Linepithema humile TaxID=83485 RepID=UPI00351EAFB9
MVAKRSNYKDFMWAIELCRFGLKVTGLWPENHKTNKNNFISNIHATIVFIMITFVSVIPLICSLVRIWGNMILMIDNLQVTITLTAIWAKFVIMRWKRSAISSIVNMIAEDWMYLKINAERNVMIRQAQIARFVIISGYFMVIFGFSVVIILPSFGVHYRLLTNLTAGVRALPMQGYYFYDTDKSPQFEFTLAAQAITTFLACVTYTSVDAFLALIIFHICGQLENFRYQLLNLASSDNFANALRYNVETHLRLIRFADNIENVYAVLMLTLLFYFSSVFCLYSYPLVTVTSDETNNKSFSRIGFSIIGVIMLLAHTFFYCGGGQLMAKELMLK